MRDRSIMIAFASLITVILIMLVWQRAPQTTLIGEDVATAESASCLTDAAGDCLRLPAVSGLNLMQDTVQLPDDLIADWHLIVMPFDRDQQVNALTWLPVFEELAASRDDLDYYSVAALPDLNAGIRILVVEGMRAGVRDDALRQKSILLFLEDQAAYLDALQIPDTEQIQIWLTDAEGVVYWQQSGDYTTEGGDELIAAITQILAD